MSHFLNLGEIFVCVCYRLVNWMILHYSPNEFVEVRVRSRRTLAPTVTQMSKKWCATCLTGQPRSLAAAVTNRSTTVSNQCTKMSSPAWPSSRYSNSLNTANIIFL